jgi:hypothetical protein
MDEIVQAVTLARRPDLAARVPELLASRWPVFMLAGRPEHGIDLDDVLIQDFPQHQILLLRGDEIVGAGLSLPVFRDREDQPPRGWDDVVLRAWQVAGGRRSPDIVSALSVTIAPQAAGHGLAAVVIQALRDAAAAVGPDGMFVPVRPVLKACYPLIPLRSYVQWRTAAGEVFDPWLRLHLRLGARLLCAADDSLVLRGDVADWQQWTGQRFPGSGAYVIDGALAPLIIDRERDQGIYREPNQWVWHS